MFFFESNQTFNKLHNIICMAIKTFNLVNSSQIPRQITTSIFWRDNLGKLIQGKISLKYVSTKADSKVFKAEKINLK